MNGFSTLWKTTLAFSTASVIPASLKPFDNQVICVPAGIGQSQKFT